LASVLVSSEAFKAALRRFETGVAGVQAMLDLVRHAGPRDVALCLLSGGGSALLPYLMNAGAALIYSTRVLDAVNAKSSQVKTV